MVNIEDTYTTMPYAPSPMYARFVYRGPTSKGCSLTISTFPFPTTHSIAILVFSLA